MKVIPSSEKLKNIFILGYLVFLPLMKFPKIELNGKLDLFFSKMEYSDILLLIFSIVFIKDIILWLKSSENKKCRNILILVALIFTLSSLFSFNKYISFFDTLGLYMLMILFVLFSGFIKTYDTLIFINKVNLYVATIVSLFGIIVLIVYSIYGLPALKIFFYLNSKNNNSVFLNRISSTLTLPEMLITYLNVALVSGFLAYQSDKNYKILFFIGIIIIAACLAFSRSLTGFFVTFSLILLLFKSKNIKYKIFTWISIFLTTCLLITAVLFSVYNIYPSKSPSKLNYGYEKRYYMALSGLRILNSYPLLGVGPGSYSYEAKKYMKKKPVYVADSKILKDLSKGGMDPHSLYLGLLAETGLLGTLSIILFLSFLFFKNREMITKYNAEIEFVRFCQIFEAGLIGMLITGFFVDLLSMRHFWILLAIFYGAANQNLSVKNGLSQHRTWLFLK